MKIGIISENADYVYRTGIGHYAFNLIKSAVELDSENEYYLLHYKKKNLDDTLYKICHNKCKEVLLPNLPIPLWKTLYCMILPHKFSNKLDVIYHPSTSPFLLKGGVKRIVTVHDVTPMLFLETHTLREVYIYKYILPRILKNVDKIIAVTKSTRIDLINYFSVPEEKIVVIFEAVDEKFKPLNKEEINEVEQKYNLNFPFILYVGTLEPRKNIPTLIKAFYEIKKKNLPHKLVITGKKGWKYKEIWETIDKSNLQNNVVFTGYVLDEDLPALYNAADLFVYPSIYEGFGLPPLEAMACGTPVITANTSSLPEVVGDAGIMVDPQDVDRLADAMHDVLSNDGLRESMIKRGLERAKLFRGHRKINSNF